MKCIDKKRSLTTSIGKRSLKCLLNDDVGNSDFVSLDEEIISLIWSFDFVTFVGPLTSMSCCLKVGGGTFGWRLLVVAFAGSCNIVSPKRKK